MHNISISGNYPLSFSGDAGIRAELSKDKNGCELRIDGLRVHVNFSANPAMETAPNESLFQSIQYLNASVDDKTGVLTLKCKLHFSEDGIGRRSSPDSGNSGMSSLTDTDLSPSSPTLLNGVQESEREAAVPHAGDGTLMIGLVGGETASEPAYLGPDSDSDSSSDSGSSFGFGSSFENAALTGKYPIVREETAYLEAQVDNALTPRDMRLSNHSSIYGNGDLHRSDPEELTEELTLMHGLPITDMPPSPGHAAGTPVVASPASPEPPVMSPAGIPVGSRRGAAADETADKTASENGNISLGEMIRGLKHIEKDAIELGAHRDPELNRTLNESCRTLQFIYGQVNQSGLLKEGESGAGTRSRRTMKNDLRESTAEFLSTLNAAHPWPPEMKVDCAAAMKAILKLLDAEHAAPGVAADTSGATLGASTESRDPDLVRAWKNTLKSASVHRTVEEMGDGLGREVDGTQTQKRRRGVRGASLPRIRNEPQELDRLFFESSVAKLHRRVFEAQRIKEVEMSNPIGISAEEENSNARLMEEVQKELIDFILRWSKPKQLDKLLADQMAPSGQGDAPSLAEILENFTQALTEIGTPLTAVLTEGRRPAAEV